MAAFKPIWYILWIFHSGLLRLKSGDFKRRTILLVSIPYFLYIPYLVDIDGTITGNDGLEAALMQSFDADGSSLDPCQLQNSSNTGQFSQFYVIDRVIRCTICRNVFPLYIYWMLCGNMKSILFIFLKVKFKNYNDFHNDVANWNCQYCFDGRNWIRFIFMKDWVAK